MTEVGSFWAAATKKRQLQLSFAWKQEGRKVRQQLGCRGYDLQTLSQRSQILKSSYVIPWCFLAYGIRKLRPRKISPRIVGLYARYFEELGGAPGVEFRKHR